MIDARESRGPRISRNCENPRDAFAHPDFGRLSRLALRGEYKLLRRSRLDGSPGRNRQPAMERTHRLCMDDDQRRFDQRRHNDLFRRAQGRRRNATIEGLVCPVQADRLRAESAHFGRIQFLQFKRDLA